MTFVLFSYNQERYIREAVEAALAQTYEPLEIVLSDDASTDGTFAIIQELAADYAGPHEVRVVGNPRNLGIVPHVLARGREAKGNLVVVAAGDDISKPERTDRLVAPFLEDRDVLAAVSRVDVIDDRGATLAKGAVRPLHLDKPNIYLRTASGTNDVIQGCAAAYRKEVFSLPLPQEKLEFPEDLLFSFYINLAGRSIARVDDSLVAYRAHEGAISNKSIERRTLNASMQRTYEAARTITNMIEAFRFLSEKLGNADLVDHRQMNRDYSVLSAIVNWQEMSLSRKCVDTAKSLATLDMRLLKWILLRMIAKS